MPSEVTIAKRGQSNIDERCRWRNPRTEERCSSKAIKKSDGTQTGYCEKHTGYSGVTASSLLSPISSGIRRVGR